MTEETRKKISDATKKQWRDGKASTAGCFKKGMISPIKGKHIWNGKKHPCKKEEILKICAICGKEFYVLPSRKWRKLCSINCQLIQSKQRIKDKHPNWKGGIKNDNDKRKSYDAINWRTSVFLRDNWTCQKCENRGGILRAHHIQNYYKYKELRFVENNGITLCDKCHRLFHHIYGKKENSFEQIEEFICQKEGGGKILNQDKSLIKNIKNMFIK